MKPKKSNTPKSQETVPAIVFPLTGGKNMYAPLCYLIGAITIASNAAYEQLFRLFWMASGLSKEAAEAIFFSIKSDSGQRNITRSIISCSKKVQENHKVNALEWIEFLEKKSSERNAAIHTMWDGQELMDGKVLSSSKISKEYHHKKLSNNVVNQFGSLINELFRATLELSKAAKIFEILKTESIEDVKKINGDDFLEQHSQVPRFAEINNLDSFTLQQDEKGNFYQASDKNAEHLLNKEI